MRLESTLFQISGLTFSGQLAFEGEEAPSKTLPQDFPAEKSAGAHPK